LRGLALAGALMAAVALSGCNSDVAPNIAGRARAPIPPRLLADIADKNMDVGSPILVRVFKTESELEVWKQDRSGRYALLKTYPICKWSGDLGPKIREGDRQAPEGFYDITPGQMNPNSQYFLAFNLGYPNAFDRAHDRTGAHLMVHGDCSSRGCYAMSDEQIAEIFALGRESFFAGQKHFQVQAYPFRMTAANMAKHRTNPNLPFWRMLKEGNDHFEVTRQEPKVDVCDKRYVFNATGGNFSPRGKCPTYEVPQEVAEAVQAKQRDDEMQIAQLAARGTPTAPIKTGRDGGMHPTFVAKLQPREILDERGNAKLVVDRGSPTVVAYSPVLSSDTTGNSTPAAAPVETANVSAPRNTPQPKAGERAEPSFADKLASFFRGGSTREAEPQTRVAAAEPKAARQPREGVKAKVSRVISGLRGSSEPKQTETQPQHASAARAPGAAPKVKTADATPAAAAPAPAAAAPAGMMSGAQPIPQTSSFESRFGAFR
jgi:murein L,D-transpeptidase YafK